MYRNACPKGEIGELVGFNGGYTSSETVPARIIGATKTTVSIMVGDRRVTFNRSNWQERGTGGSRFAAYLVNEAGLRRDQSRRKLLKAEREDRAKIHKRLSELAEAMRFAQDSEAYYRLAVALQEVAQGAKSTGMQLAVLEQVAENDRKAVLG